MPKDLLQSSKVSFVMSAIHALDGQNRLEFVVPGSRYFLKYYEEIAGMHLLIALSKLVFFFCLLILILPVSFSPPSRR